MNFIQKYFIFIFFCILIAGYEKYSRTELFSDDGAPKPYMSFAEFTFLNDVPDYDDLLLEERQNGFKKEDYHLIVSYHPSTSSNKHNMMIMAKSRGTDLSDINIFETGNLKGLIVDVNGTPLPDIKVELHGLGSSTYTDTNGHFVLTDIPPGNHLILVQKEGYYADRLARVSVMSQDDFTIEPLVF